MDIQGCWTAMAPSRKEDVCRSGAGARHQAGSLFDGSQSCRLGSTEENIPDRIVAGNSVSISPTSNLVVSEHVSDSSAFRAGVRGTVKRDPQPVAQATTELLVVEVKAQRR